MTRLLFVTPTLEHRGSTKQLALLAAGLSRERFAVTVTALGAEGPVGDCLRRAGTPVVALGWKRAIDPGSFRRLRRQVEQSRPKVIHAWGLGGLRAVAAVGGMRQSRVILSAESALSRRSALRRQLDAWLLRRVDRLVVAGPAEVGPDRELRLPEDRVAVIPPGVAPPGPSPSREALLASLRLPASARLIVSAGPLEPWKGFRDAIWAFDILKYLYRDLHLVLVGTGPEREALASFVRAIEAADRIHLAGPQVDVSVWLAQAEVVWVPSRRRGGTNVALEAMAVGRPVVASRLPGLAEIVLDGQTGYLVPPGDKVALARQTQQLLDEAACCRRMGEAGQRRAAAHFAVTDMIDRFAQLYLAISDQQSAREALIADC